jgi:hypothetical protein
LVRDKLVSASLRCIAASNKTQSPEGLLRGSLPTSLRSVQQHASMPVARSHQNRAKRKARLTAGIRLTSAFRGKSGAGEGARTLDPDLGKVVLYH